MLWDREMRFYVYVAEVLGKADGAVNTTEST